MVEQISGYHSWIMAKRTWLQLRKPLRVMSWFDNDESAAILSTAILIFWESNAKIPTFQKLSKIVIALQGEFRPNCRRLIALIFTGEMCRCGGFDIPSAPSGDAVALREFLSKFSPLRFTTYTRTAGFCLKDKSNLSAWRAKIRLFCSRWKWCLLQANTPLPASAVAEGITH